MIRGPKNATPTNRGWINPKTGELLKAQKITDAQIAEWNGEPVVAAPAPASKEWVAEDLNQDGLVDEMESMTKIQLEELGRDNGVELDRRKSRKKLIEQMRNILSK